MEGLLSSWLKKLSTVGRSNRPTTKAGAKEGAEPPPTLGTSYWLSSSSEYGAIEGTELYALPVYTEEL